MSIDCRICGDGGEDVGAIAACETSGDLGFLLTVDRRPG